MELVRQLPGRAKVEIKRRLRGLLAGREEVRFACLHGSVVEPRGFRDVDLTVRVDPHRVPREAALDYEFEVSAWLERGIPHPVDVKVLNYAPLGFRYAVTQGEPLVVRDLEAWRAFRETTWEAYLDVAPLSRAMLLDLLGAPPARSAR